MSQNNNPNYYKLFSLTSSTTTSSIPIIMTDMTVTPKAGTYLVTFSGSGKTTESDADCSYSIFIGDVKQQDSTRCLFHDTEDSSGHPSNLTLSMHTQAIVTLDGNTAVSVKWKTNKGVFKVSNRNFLLVKII